MYFEFKLTLDEANLVLGALSKFPYEQVSGLITNIKTQADPQIPRVQKEMEELAAAAQKAEMEQTEQAKNEVVNMTESKSDRRRKTAQQKIVETPEETGVPEYPTSV